MLRWDNVLITDQFAVNALVERAKSTGICAIDTETDGLFWPLGHQAFMATFCPSIEGMKGEGGKAYACYKPQLVHDALCAFEEAGIKFLFHNAVFDFHMLRVWTGYYPVGGYETLWVEDTMHGFRTLYPGQSAELKVASKRYISAEDMDVDGPQKAVKAWIAEHTRVEKQAGKSVKIEPGYHEVPVDIMLPYATQDVVMTLIDHLRLAEDRANTPNPARLLPGTPTAQQVYDDECALIKTVVEMERAGMPVLHEELADGLKVGQAEMERLLEEWIASPFGNVKPGSAIALRKLFYTDLGEPVKHKTKPTLKNPDGQPSTSEAALLDFETDLGKAAAEILLPYRAWNKYVEKLSEFMSYMGFDGRIHGSIRADTARTGRFSIIEPALQNLARPNKAKRYTLARAVFGYHVDEDRELGLADFSQIELRLAAHFMNDEVAIQQFIDGIDQHKHTACQMYGVTPDQVTKAQRAIAKIMRFSILYGAGKVRVTETLRYGAAGVDPLTPAEVRSALTAITGTNINEAETTITDTCVGYEEALDGEKVPIIERTVTHPTWNDYKGEKEPELYTILAGKLLDRFHEENPLVKQFLNKAANNAKKYKCVYTAFGLRIPIPEPSWSPIYKRFITYDHKAGNAVIQGTAAGLMKATIRRATKVCRKFCEERGLKMWEDIKIILTIHDELIFDVPEGMWLPLAQALDPVLSHWPQFKVPIKLEYAIVKPGNNWAFKEEMELEAA